MHAAIRSVSGNELRKQIAQELSGHVDLAAMISRMCLVTLQTCMLVLARSWPQPCRPMLTMSYNAWWPRSDRMTASHSLMSSCRQGSANRPGRDGARQCDRRRSAFSCAIPLSQGGAATVLEVARCWAARADNSHLKLFMLFCSVSSCRRCRLNLSFRKLCSEAISRSIAFREREVMEVWHLSYRMCSRWC